MRRNFAELNQKSVGALALLVTVLLLVVALNLNGIRSALGQSFQAEFRESAGLNVGSDVEISGVRVGQVRAVEIEGDRVVVSFTTDRTLGDETTASIKSATVLGTKVLSLRPDGSADMADGERIPLARTTSPYDLTTAVADLTTTTGKLDTDLLARALNSISATFEDTPDELRTILKGTRRLAEVVNKRDAQLASLLENANLVTGVLAERNAEIISIISDADLVLAALEEREWVLSRLVDGLDEVTTQVSGVLRDNEDLVGPAMAELNRTLDVVNAHRKDLREALTYFSGFTQSLFDALGNGPFFYGYLGGVAPANMAPLIDDVIGDLDGGE